MKVFRDSLPVEGEPLSATVIQSRREERYRSIAIASENNIRLVTADEALAGSATGN
jgi:hypothetical protein